ncbi:MAG: prepilin peptidase [Firmicutes bacterium]|nr:prepilin peptidase [Bacillota bacterium]
MTLPLQILITCAVAIVLGVILGSSAVYVFNRIPAAWLTDYGEEPSEELKDTSTQRVKSVPWKYVFTGLFIALGIYLGVRDLSIALPVIIALWLLLLMSIADIKYMIVPDQLIMLLVLTGLGFLPQKIALYHRHAVYDSLMGAAAGLILMLIIALFSRAIYKKWVLGGADIKLFTAIGFLTGLYGVLIIFVLSTVLSGLHFAYLLIRQKIQLRETRPMVPYIALSFGIYFLFIRSHITDFIITI